MNERIKQLVEKSKEQTAKYNSLRNKLTVEEWEEIYNKKFAELIVRECADIAKLTDSDDGDDYKSGRSWAGIDILKHFGVE